MVDFNGLDHDVLVHLFGLILQADESGAGRVALVPLSSTVHLQMPAPSLQAFPVP